MKTPTSTSALESKASAFVSYLVKHKDDRGMMAALRSALSEARKTQAWPYLAAFNGIGENRESLVVQTIAGLFATHPLHSDELGDFGSTCRKIAYARSHGKDSLEDAFESRFKNLIASDADEILQRIVSMVLRAKSENVAINYQRLYCDLTYWSGNGIDRVRIRWGRSFWIGSKDAGAETEDAPEITNVPAV